MSDEPGRSERTERTEGPTEVVESASGELVERLSGGTATLLLVWLIGVGALLTLLAAWAFVWVVTSQRLGIGSLLGGFGLYTAVAGASGPCILWLTGRAQGHSLPWFILRSAKIALLMVASILAVIVVAALVLVGTLPSFAGVVAAGVMALMAVGLSVVWALATWGADRWIARARLDEPTDRG